MKKPISIALILILHISTTCAGDGRVLSLDTIKTAASTTIVFAGAAYTAYKACEYGLIRAFTNREYERGNTLGNITLGSAFYIGGIGSLSLAMNNLPVASCLHIHFNNQVSIEIISQGLTFAYLGNELNKNL